MVAGFTTCLWFGTAPAYAQLSYDKSQDMAFLIPKPHRLGSWIATMVYLFAPVSN